MESIKIAVLILLQALLAKAASITKSDRSRESIHVMSRPYYMAHACERTFLTLECGSKQKIQLAHATYGRQNDQLCVAGHSDSKLFWSLNCSAPVRRTTRIVADICNGKEKCTVPVVNFLFTDPCPTTYKYLEIYYTCVES